MTIVSLLQSGLQSGRARSSVMVALAGVCAAALAGCADQSLSPAAIPAHAAAPPPVSLSSHVLEAASEYRAYVRLAASTPASFSNGPAIEQSLATAEAYESQQLSRGVVAYGAMVALQDPSFVAGVRTYAVDPEGRRSLAAKIVADPRYAAALPSASSAAGLVIASMNADGAKIRGAGELVKQFAYDVQHQAWSKKDIIDPASRLARAKSESAAPMSPVPSDVEELKSAVNTGDSKVASPMLLSSRVAAAPPYTPVVNRALAVAALAALGEGGEENDAQMEALLSESSGGFCLNMSKLNLYQCLAVAKPWYEDVFCLGQHVLIDTGQCLTKEAGTPTPVADAAPQATPAAPAAPSAVAASAPVAGAGHSPGR
jgi:hypothetical protein